MDMDLLQVNGYFNFFFSNFDLIFTNKNNLSPIRSLSLLTPEGPYHPTITLPIDYSSPKSTWSSASSFYCY